jgi:hypothetical protein
MNTFLPKSLSKLQSLNWLLEATTLIPPQSLHGRDFIHITVVPGQKDGQWKADLGKIDAALSLWMASIDARRSEAAHSSDPNSEPSPD